MSKNDVANGNLGAAANNMQENSSNIDTKEFKSNLNNEQQQPSKPQQNVRQIPIYVEGRSEPLMNKVDTSAAFGGTGRTLGGGSVHNVPLQHNTEIPRPATSSSIFSRVKDIPVKVIPGFDTGSRRSASPASAAAGAAGVARNIPIQVQHTTSNRKLPNLPQDHDHVRKSPSPCPQVPQDPITKIQNIQGEVIDLMSKVEAFNGTKKSKEYVYLDEMLTQTLLKLDTIDTDGKENIKAARKEVINCINKCITALESKANEAETNKNLNYDSASTESANKETNSSSAGGAKCDQNKT